MLRNSHLRNIYTQKGQKVPTQTAFVLLLALTSNLNIHRLFKGPVESYFDY